MSPETDHGGDPCGPLPPVAVVLDPGDDAAVTRDALAAHAPDQGRVTVHPTPASTHPATLGSDLLTALGTPAAQLGPQQAAGIKRAWQVAAAWIIGERIRQVIILRGHRLVARSWTKLVELRTRTGIGLVIVYHRGQLTGPARAALAGVSHHITHTLTGVLAPAPIPTPTPEPDTDANGEGGLPLPPLPLPPLPASEVVRFRADAWRWLSPAGFARVDACYSTGLAAARGWITTHPDYLACHPQRGTAPTPPDSLPAQDGEPTADLLSGPRANPAERVMASRCGDTDGLQLMLSQLVATSPSRRHTLARLRGAQAGFLLHGVLLELPAGLGGLPGPGMGPIAFTDRLAGRIRAQAAHPVLAAALATAAFTGLDHATIRTIAPQDLSGDASVLRPRIQHRTHPRRVTYFVPQQARGLLRAARAYHALGDRPSPRLFANPAAAFAAAAQACRIPLPTAPTSARQAPVSWHERARCYWLATPSGGPHSEPLLTQAGSS